MPASEKFTVDLSAVEVPDLDLGGRTERRKSKPAATPPARSRASSSTKGGRGKPAAPAKRYAFRRS